MKLANLGNYKVSATGSQKPRSVPQETGWGGYVSVLTVGRAVTRGVMMKSSREILHLGKKQRDWERMRVAEL